MVWVRFPYTVKYNGAFYEGGKSFVIPDDDLPNMTGQGATVVRMVVEAEPEGSQTTLPTADAPPANVPPANVPAKRGRRKREQ